jgi:hypothetical protein
VTNPNIIFPNPRIPPLFSLSVASAATATATAAVELPAKLLASQETANNGGSPDVLSFLLALSLPLSISGGNAGAGGASGGAGDGKIHDDVYANW